MGNLEIDSDFNFGHHSPKPPLELHTRPALADEPTAVSRPAFGGDRPEGGRRGGFTFLKKDTVEYWSATLLLQRAMLVEKTEAGEKGNARQDKLIQSNSVGQLLAGY